MESNKAPSEKKPEIPDSGEVIQLSPEGQMAFAQALIDPPEPNEAMKRAMARHAALIRQVPHEGGSQI